MTKWQIISKRIFDIVVSILGLVVTIWLILPCALIAHFDTNISGFFTQLRVGKDAKLFKVVKIRTMRNVPNYYTYVTTSNDPRVSRIGNFFRKSKIDELPQLFNVLIGTMSFVGPRPDLPGFADKLTGEDKIVLSIRPGITGPASLKYNEEEILLGGVADPVRYNHEVVYPDKVKINKNYINNYSMGRDIYYILRTIFR